MGSTAMLVSITDQARASTNAIAWSISVEASSPCRGHRFCTGGTNAQLTCMLTKERIVAVLGRCIDHCTMMVCIFGCYPKGYRSRLSNLDEWIPRTYGSLRPVQATSEQAVTATSTKEWLPHWNYRSTERFRGTIITVTF